MKHKKKIIKKIAKSFFVLACGFTLILIVANIINAIVNQIYSNRNLEEILIPIPHNQTEPSNEQTISRFVSKGDTIIRILTEAGLPNIEAHKLVIDVKPVYDLKKIHANQHYSIVYENNTFKKFSYDIDITTKLSVIDKDTHYLAQIITIPYEIKTVLIKGTIKTTLFESILELGEKAELADLLASLYEYDIDFNRDLRQEDSFQFIVSKKYLKERFIKYDKILAADFTNNSNTIRIIFYPDQSGTSDYYHTDGRAVKKMFLRCPLPFLRITSRYGMRRHPVLGFSAKHNGIDFGAPPGTKVRSTSSGSILRTGYDPFRGRFILIKHANLYISHYYHLNRFEKNIHPGKRINQGEVIGYVGNSGRSTGPHLHYGLQKASSFINPLTLKSPAKNPLAENELPRFKKMVTEYDFLFSLSKGQISILDPLGLPKDLSFIPLSSITRLW